MAALKEHDLMAILGANYRELAMAAEKSSGIKDEERAVREKADSAETNRFNAGALIFIGCALAFSAYYTATGQTFVIQMGVAIGFLLVGAALFVYMHRQIAPLRLRATELRRDNPGTPA